MRAFSLSLTTTVFSQRSTGWFGALPRRTTPEGQQASISSTAPPMNDVSYTTPPSAFVTHGCRIKPAEKTRSAPTEVHARADVRDRLATDRPLATDEVDDFGAHA
jgi:hypothetical protein